MKCRFLLCSTNLVLPMQDEVFVCYRTQRMMIPTSRESIAVSVRNNWTMICRHGAALLFMNVEGYLSKSRLTKLWWVNCFSNRWNGSEWQIRGLKSSKISQHHHKDVWFNSVCFHPSARAYVTGAPSLPAIFDSFYSLSVWACDDTAVPVQGRA